MANNSFLIFVKVHANRFRTYDVFVCRNKLCIPYREVCDLEDSCGDASDEEDCGNSFKCGSKYIPLSSVCDGVHDCVDLSDECNNQCGKSRVINSLF